MNRMHFNVWYYSNEKKNIFNKAITLYKEWKQEAGGHRRKKKVEICLFKKKRRKIKTHLIRLH